MIGLFPDIGEDDPVLEGENLKHNPYIADPEYRVSGRPWKFSGCGPASAKLACGSAMSDPSELTARKTIALELSVMRSGSTLLKALMAAAPDISSLPETNFQRFQSADAEKEISSLSGERIIRLGGLIRPS